MLANLSLGEGSQISALQQALGQAQAGGITGGAAGLRSGLGQVAGGLGAGLGAAAGGSGLGGSILAGLGSFFSDRKLKDNITKIGEENGFNKYKWVWNDLANKLGLFGEAFGVMADEVEKVNPEAVIDGLYKMVDYRMIGVSHG